MKLSKTYSISINHQTTQNVSKLVHETKDIFKKILKKIDDKNIEIDVDYCSRQTNEIIFYADETKIQEITKILNENDDINNKIIIQEKYENKETIKNIEIIQTNLIDRNKHKNINYQFNGYYYHFQEDIEKLFKYIINKYPHISSYETIGKSVLNRNLLMMKITNNSTFISNKQKPSILYIANIHGDETIGRELCINLIKHLCLSYENNDENIMYLIDNTNIFIMPSLNPDGFENKSSYTGIWNPQRYNANNKDLNRDFPDQFKDNNPDNLNNKQPETISIMKWSKRNHINLSLSMHAGAIVANYPFDGPTSNKENLTKDDKIFKYISTTYAESSINFIKNSEFKNGITNGSMWYALFGGMQDWRYVYKKGYEITLELSNEKIINENNIELYWNNNKNALLNMAYLLHSGVMYNILDSNNKSQFFYKFLLKGKYKLIYNNVKSDIITIDENKNEKNRLININFKNNQFYY